MIEHVLVWLWGRISIFSLGKYCPQILTPLAGRLMLILSHGIAWFHRHEYDRILAHHYRNRSQVVLGYNCWYFRKEETLNIHKFRWIDVGGYGAYKIARGKWRIAD